MKENEQYKILFQHNYIGRFLFFTSLVGDSADNFKGLKNCGEKTALKLVQKYKTINKKNIHLGYFSTAVEGAIAYNNYIIENNLEGFILNEIPQEYIEKETTNEKL